MLAIVVTLTNVILGSLAGYAFARLRFLQQGNVHIYILHIVAAAILGLAWVTLSP